MVKATSQQEELLFESFGPCPSASLSLGARSGEEKQESVAVTVDAELVPSTSLRTLQRLSPHTIHRLIGQVPL